MTSVNKIITMPTPSIKETISAHDEGEDLPRMGGEDIQKLIASAPDRIWLDLGENLESLSDDATFRDLREVTWSEDNATGCGIKYVRAPLAPFLSIDFKQADALLAMFGGEPCEITLSIAEGHSGRGLYAHYTEYPEEGVEFLGVTDGEAAPDATLPAAPQSDGWILPSDSLPEPDVDVIVWSQHFWEKAPSAKIDQWSMQREAPLEFSSATVEVGFGWNEHDDFESVIAWKAITPPTQTQGQSHAE